MYSYFLMKGILQQHRRNQTVYGGRGKEIRGMSKKTFEQSLESTGVDREDQVAKSIQSRQNSILSQEIQKGTYLVVQWLRLYIPNARNLGSISGWGTISHMLQLRPSTAK